MSPPRRLTIAVVVLAGSLAGSLAAPPSYADQPGPHTYRARGADPLETPPVHSRELRARVASLAAPGNRAAGMPAAGSMPYEQLGTATFRIDFRTGYVTVSGTLVAAPPADDLPRLAVQAGVVNGSSCDGLPGEMGGEFGTTGSLSDIDSLPPGWADANCVIALVFPQGSGPTDPPSDALVGTLTDVLEYPVLSLGRPEVLGAKKLKLVRGVWTPVSVEVSNSGTGQARAVTVTGTGTGVKVKPGALGSALAPAEDGKATSGTVVLEVKLTSKKRGATLTLSASSDAETATSDVKVTATPAPPAPTPGRYESKDGDVSFTVRGARVTRFRIRAQTQCGGYPGLPTHQVNTYDFPKTRISRAGIVFDRDQHDLYTVNLEMLVTGSKATRGRFSFYGPDRCFALETFTAKRTQR